MLKKKTLSYKERMESVFLLKGNKLEDYLSENRNDINVLNEHGKNALFQADINKTKILVKYGINIFCTDNLGFNAFYSAKNPEKIKYLLSLVKSKDELDKLSISRNGPTYSVVCKLSSIEEIMMVKNLGFNLNRVLGEGNHSRFIISDSQNVDIFKFIEKETNFIFPEYYIPSEKYETYNYNGMKKPYFMQLFNDLVCSNADKINILGYVISKNYERDLRQYNNLFKEDENEPFCKHFQKYIIVNKDKKEMIVSAFEMAKAIHEKKLINELLEKEIKECPVLKKRL